MCLKSMYHSERRSQASALSFHSPGESRRAHVEWNRAPKWLRSVTPFLLSRAVASTFTECRGRGEGGAQERSK